MLDTHRRRLLRAIPLEKSEADGTRLRAGFDPDAAYRRLGNRLVRITGTTEPRVLRCALSVQRMTTTFTAPPGGAHGENPGSRDTARNPPRGLSKDATTAQ